MAKDDSEKAQNGSVTNQDADDNCDTAPPDGGWGWVVTFSSFMISFLVDGVCFTFGIFFSEFRTYFGGSKGKTSLLGSVLNGAYLTLGPIVAALSNRFGCRPVAIAGGIMSFLGFFLCSFSPNLDVMIFLYGFIGGSGFGLMYLPAIVMVGYYFEKRRAFATGIAVCGSGIGSFVFAPLAVLLLQIYSWQGAMWIVGGVVLNGVVFAFAFRPLHPKCLQNKQIHDGKRKQDVAIVLNENGNDAKKPFSSLEIKLSSENPIYRCRSVDILSNGKNDKVARLAHSQDISSLSVHKDSSKHIHHHLNPLARKDIFYSGSLRNIPKNDNERYGSKCDSIDKGVEEEEEDSMCRKTWLSVAKSFDFSLLKSPTFIIYGISCFLCMFGFFIPFNFLPDLVIDLKLEKSQGATLIAIIGVSNTVTRIVVGFVTDRPWANSLVINNFSLVIGGVTTFAVPYYPNFVILAIYAVVFGASIAAFVSLRSIIMVELMGIEKLSNAFGLVVLCQGLSSFIGSPIAGSLSDVTGTYNITFYLAGITMFLAGVICIPLRRVAKWEGLQSTDVDVSKINGNNNHNNEPEIEPMLTEKSQ